MPVHINVGGVWKECDDVHINVGGVWKTCDDAPINVGGVWKTGLLATPDVVTLSGGSNNAFKFGANALAYFWFNSDGTVDTQDNTSSPIQVNASTDWVIPNGSAPGSYRVKYSSLTGDTSFFSGTVGATYTALTSSRYFYVFDTTTTAGGKSATCTAHIDDGTTEQDTGSYTMTADREDF
jgi:hypothetical protein